MNLPLLKTSIAHHIEMTDKDGVVSEDRRVKMVNSLTDFVERAVIKYVKGQKEHGDNIEKRDLDKEIEQEHTDTFWYMEAKKWQKK